MNKKTGLQVVMVLVIILISLWFYLKYFTKNFEYVKEARVIEKIDENQNSTSTYIDDINYVSNDAKGNKYQISAKQAEIKVENSDTIFSENVIVIYPGHKIAGEYLDFSFLNNLGTFTTNVVYNGERTNLFADKIEINLTTKDTKIFMNGTEKKVLIKGTK